MKKVSLATLISSALIGCGGDYAPPQSEQSKFDICNQVQLVDDVIINLEVRELPMGVWNTVTMTMKSSLGVSKREGIR